MCAYVYQHPLWSHYAAVAFSDRIDNSCLTPWRLIKDVWSVQIWYNLRDGGWFIGGSKWIWYLPSDIPFFLPYACLRMFSVCNPVSGQGGLHKGSDKMGHQLLPTLPLCPHFPLPRPLSCCLPWRETHNSFMLPVYHLSHHLVLPLSLAALVGRLYESAYGDILFFFTPSLNNLFEWWTAALLVRVICSI